MLDYDDELTKLQSKIGCYYHIDEIIEDSEHVEVIWHVHQT
ncbi:hypothetical protein GCM10008018_31170 [Paenibacillus marchantiophytorum]|uniref:Uncharacterized protein n=1 Tax=Paenibacillus marchantiophytorum TaxID=1619310 RepID=A0ABQ1ER52_9BACL|nr:hypothetical protein GCM10008018_31170 [Paenibacillus marchantiophytorum]